jgi:hypothetical protein
LDQAKLNWVNMFFTVVLPLGKFGSLVDTITLFRSAVDIFIANTVRIRPLMALQIREIAGVAADKAEAREIMTRAVYPIAGILLTYAIDKGDMTLKEIANISRTDLLSGNAGISASKAREIVIEAEPRSTELVQYGIKAETIADAKTKIETFESLIGEPRDAIAVRHAAAVQLDDLIHENLSLLKNKLDKFMLQFQYTHPEFYEEYMMARVVVDLGVRHEKKESSRGDAENAENEKNF